MKLDEVIKIPELYIKLSLKVQKQLAKEQGFEILEKIGSFSYVSPSYYHNHTPAINTTTLPFSVNQGASVSTSLGGSGVVTTAGNTFYVGTSTATAPSFTFSGNTNTGLYNLSASVTQQTYGTQLSLDGFSIRYFYKSKIVAFDVGIDYFI
jgi:hypothetical protein